jgi:hypothetical protein
MLKKLLIISTLYFLVGCSQKDTIENMELKCVGDVSFKSTTDPKSNVELSRNIKISFNIQDSKIFYSFDLLYLSLPRDGIKCLKVGENINCEFNQTKDNDEHTISINLDNSLKMKIIEKINQKNQDRMTSYIGNCQKVIY